MMDHALSDATLEDKFCLVRLLLNQLETLVKE
jgi:hypothetical protein